MKVFLFDLVHYPGDLDRFRVNGELPDKLGKSAVDPKLVAKTYAEHLDVWEEMDRLGFDGLAVNEHHATPFGLMNSPNLFVASAIQRTKRMKILTYGNLLPLHNPLRLAEEFAMLDCLSSGRLIAGVARGAQREYRAYNLPLSESRARFEECFAIMKQAWTQESFSYEGKFHSYKDVAIWPRPVQQPYPPVWVPVTASKETIEWAAANDAAITPGVPGAGTARADIIRHYARCQAQFGRKVSPANFNFLADSYVADSKEAAIEEYGADYAYSWNTLMQYDHSARDYQEKGYYSDKANEHLRPGASAPPRLAVSNAPMTVADVRERVRNLPWGSPDEVVNNIIAEADESGLETVLIQCNRGAMSKEKFLEQVRRIARDVLPRLQAHTVKLVPAAEGISD